MPCYHWSAGVWRIRTAWTHQTGELTLVFYVFMHSYDDLKVKCIKQEARGHGASVDTLYSLRHGLSENLFPCCIILYDRRYGIVRRRQVLETTG